VHAGVDAKPNNVSVSHARNTTSVAVFAYRFGSFFSSSFRQGKGRGKAEAVTFPAKPTSPHTNQETIQPTSQLTNQPNNQPNNQSTSQPTTSICCTYRDIILFYFTFSAVVFWDILFR